MKCSNAWSMNEWHKRGASDCLPQTQVPAKAKAFRVTDLPITQPTCLNTHFQSRADLPYCVTPSIKRFTPVQEFQPVVHRLRFSASALVPTYPETTIVAQESLCFRWKGFSPFFSLLIPTFSLPTSPPNLPVRLLPYGNAPLPRILYVYSHSFGFVL